MRASPHLFRCRPSLPEDQGQAHDRRTGKSRKTSAFARKRRLANGHERTDSLRATRLNVARLTATELENIHGPVRYTFLQVRVDQLSYEGWVLLCTGMHKAKAIDDTGISRGLQPMVVVARNALDAIHDRTALGGSAWSAQTHYAVEIAALSDLVWAYRTMLFEVTCAEAVRDKRPATARVASTGGEVLNQTEAST